MFRHHKAYIDQTIFYISFVLRSAAQYQRSLQRIFMCFYTPAEGMMISVGGYNDFSQVCNAVKTFPTL